MGMAAPLYYSAEMVRALPDDGNRYETVHGELLVTPAPRALHQLVAHRLAAALAAYLEGERVGQVFQSPADISWAPDVLVQPDVFVVALDEARTMEWDRMRTLLLALEVLSPSTTRADRFTKRRLYQEAAVATYWAVDLEAREVEEWTPEATCPRVLRDALVWAPTGASQPLTLPLERLFRPL
jgi:Uma2 family endonuclease